MKVYDSFIFNNELELLLLRFHYLNDVVDYFVIAESTRTLSGEPKPLYFKKNENLFKSFLHKVIYVEVPNNQLPGWEYEYYQRNFIKKGLEHCADDDIIIISDADEIVNIKEVLPLISEDGAYLIELPMYYYWFNLKTNYTYFLNIVSKWKYIKNIDIGERYSTYPQLFKHTITLKEVNTGWHFSYLFGLDTKKYSDKIASFSHQEYNTPYYLKSSRIKKCVQLGVDIFERPFMQFHFSIKELKPLLPFIHSLKLTSLIYRQSFKTYLSFENWFFLLKNIYLPKGKVSAKKILRPVKQWLYPIK